MFPMLPVAFVGGLLTSLLGLSWYESLSKEQKELADRRAAELARTLFNSTLANLTQQQTKFVYDQAKVYLGY